MFLFLFKTGCLVIFYLYLIDHHGSYLLLGTLGAADITTICPDTYTDGATSVVFCSINTTAVASATCFETPTRVLIELKRSDRLPTVLCPTTYPGTCANANVTCDCVSNVNNVATYRAQFTANVTTQNGSSISCSIGCEPPLSTNTSVGCQSMTFSFNSSSNHGSPADENEPYCTQSCKIGLGVGITCGIIAVAVGIILGK